MSAAGLITVMGLSFLCLQGGRCGDGGYSSRLVYCRKGRSE